MAARTASKTLKTSNPFIRDGNVIDGAAVARDIRKEIRREVTRLAEMNLGSHDGQGNVPGLATVIVGHRPDSVSYVEQKRRQVAKVGMASVEVSFPLHAEGEAVQLKEAVQWNEQMAHEKQNALVQRIQELNQDPRVHGILVQLPLPKYMDERVVVEQIAPEKDVDGFRSQNIGRLAMKNREALFVPCTTLGIAELLDRCEVDVEGKDAVVIGTSNIVGLPTAMMLLRRHATVQMCHSRTVDLAQKVRRADVVISAAGHAGLIRADWIKPDAVVIDVANNAVDDASSPRGYRFVGDVDYEECRKVAGLISPVPGGVGPMTITMLLKNTLLAFKRIHGVL